jgi:hypothetical protein
MSRNPNLERKSKVGLSGVPAGFLGLIIGPNWHKRVVEDLLMIYLMAFLGVIAVAVLVTTSPLVFRFFEYLFPVADKDGQPAKTASSHSVERVEIRDEIRRLTAALESDRREAGR